MHFFIILLTVMASVSCSSSALDDSISSSFLYFGKDFYLEGHVSHHQEAASVLSCAQLCLRSRPVCRSLNYGNKEGTMVCELNDKGIHISAETRVTSLVPMSGFIFGQMLDLTVGKNTKSA